MDSFADPRKPSDTSVSLADVRAQVQKLEADLHDKGVPLSGRIVHVCHYLPVTCSFARRPRPSDIPSPPATPPAKAADIPPSPSAESQPPLEQPAVSETTSSQWSLHVRYGHSAMVSGIDSLSVTHEQVFVGWTGDIQSASATPNADGSLDPATSKIPTASIKEEDRKELEGLLDEYRSRDGPKEGKDIRYVPVWLDDKDAHGHYDGYCKQSECPRSSVPVLRPSRTPLSRTPSLSHSAVLLSSRVPRVPRGFIPSLSEHLPGAPAAMSLSEVAPPPLPVYARIVAHVLTFRDIFGPSGGAIPDLELVLPLLNESGDPMLFANEPGLLDCQIGHGVSCGPEPTSPFWFFHPVTDP